ncbi:MAG: hypothetical protein ACE5HX_17325, partial [bacterium]
QGDSWKDASILVEQGIQREVRALNSVSVFAKGNRNNIQTIGKLIDRMKVRKGELLADLKTYYRQLYGSNPRSVKLTTKELTASKRTPMNTQSLKDYFTNRRNVKFDGKLHSLMRNEVYNFVDGQRSYYDIYKAVRAEAMTIGSWYYGTVTLDEVVDLLDAAVAANVLMLK